MRAELEGFRHTIDGFNERMELANFSAAVQFFLTYPGAREVWATYRVGFPIVAGAIDRTLAEAGDVQR